MNEFHRVFVQPVRVGEKDIDLTIEEFYEPGNLVQPVRFKVTGPNGLQSDSMQGMLRLLGVAPRSEEPASQPPGLLATPASGALSQVILQPGNTDHSLPETGLSGIIEDAFDSISGTSTLLRNETKSPLLSGTSSQPKRAQSVSYCPPSSVVEDTEEDLGDLTRDFQGSAEHGARMNKFEKEHPYLWNEYDEALENESCERNSVVEDMEVVWWAERTRILYPERYAAALDPEKCREYMDKNDYWDEGQRESFGEWEQVDGAEASDAPRCQFIKSDGDTCGSYAVKNKRFCYFHSQTAEGRKKKRKKASYIPVLEDDLAVQMAVTNICRGLAEETLERKRAATLLYGLQVATVALRRKAKTVC